MAIDRPTRLASVRRNWFIAAIVIGVLAIVVAAVVMRLSDDGPPTTAEWADAVCYEPRRLARARSRRSPTRAASRSPRTRSAISSTTRTSATTELVTELRDLGAAGPRGGRRAPAAARRLGRGARGALRCAPGQRRGRGGRAAERVPAAARRARLATSRRSRRRSATTVTTLENAERRGGVEGRAAAGVRRRALVPVATGRELRTRVLARPLLRACRRRPVTIPHVDSFVFFIVPLVLGFWAQHRVKSTFAKNLQVPVANGMTGAQVARRVLDANGLNEVPVEETPGTLSDHYDPRSRSVHLSPEVFQRRLGRVDGGRRARGRPRDPAREVVRVLQVPQRAVPRRAVRVEHLDALPARRDLPPDHRLHPARGRALRASRSSSSS